MDLRICGRENLEEKAVGLHEEKLLKLEQWSPLKSYEEVKL